MLGRDVLSERTGSVTEFSHRAVSGVWFLSCPFLNSWIEEGHLIPISVYSLHFEDLGFVKFYKHIVNQL